MSTPVNADGCAIEVTALTKRFGGRAAVQHVSLSADGGVIGVLGPNGAGKTTMLRMIATVLAPDSGRLRLLGLDPALPRERVQIRRRLGYLPQSPELYPGFSVYDLVDYVAVLKEITDRSRRRAEVTRVLGCVGLEAQARQKIRRLSGGMRQRVALAAAMLGSPLLLVLDEPAAGLDPDQRIELRTQLGQHHTTLMATHNTSEAAALCHTVLVMSAGQVRFTGAPAQLAALATGRVWEDEHPDPRALRSWVTATGVYRHVGDPPVGADAVEPTLDDGYLLLHHQAVR